MSSSNEQSSDQATNEDLRTLVWMLLDYMFDYTNNDTQRSYLFEQGRFKGAQLRVLTEMTADNHPEILPDSIRDIEVAKRDRIQQENYKKFLEQLKNEPPLL